MSFEIWSRPIDCPSLRRRLVHSRTGAVVEFTGVVRDHQGGQAVQSLEYSAHEGLAVKEGERILAEVRERFGLELVVAVHRVGHLQVGDLAVWVGVASAHRGAAFAACRLAIDEIKERVPIWKKEHYEGAPASWVENASG
ncbi:MAG: molybdenum cofactor biosynthesis protein MoaE [Verrucomicrobiota bacterium]